MNKNELKWYAPARKGQGAVLIVGQVGAGGKRMSLNCKAGLATGFFRATLSSPFKMKIMSIMYLYMGIIL